MSKSDKSSLQKVQQVVNDTFVLYMKTYAVHWNYTGANFFSVHKLTEGQYQELADAVDTIAERIRAVGHEAPISLANILQSSDLKELKSDRPSASMIEELVQGHELLSKRALAAAQACEEEGDEYGHDLMTARIGAHDKAHWMLKSMLRG